MERRFRWTVRQVLAAVEETRDDVTSGRAAEVPEGERLALMRRRLDALGGFFSLIDAGIGAFVRGEPFPAQRLAEVVP